MLINSCFCRLHANEDHPPQGLCDSTRKKDWKPTYGIVHILVTVKCLLINPNAESALDEDAGRELLENYESYFAAKLITSVHASTPRVGPLIKYSYLTANNFLVSLCRLATGIRWSSTLRLFFQAERKCKPAEQPHNPASSPSSERVQRVSENLPTPTLLSPTKPRSKGH
jgi:hypothetical protein